MGRTSGAGFVAVIILALVACDPDTPGTTTPPPPPPPPPILQVSAPSRHTDILVGEAAPPDSVTVAIFGDGSTAVSWSAQAKRPWTTLTTNQGTGHGKVRWTRSSIGLPAGVYVDTITITAVGAAGSPQVICDTLIISTMPVPLVLWMQRASGSATAAQGTGIVKDSVAVTLTGTGAASANWGASNRRAHTTVTTGAGMGSGMVRWTRSLSGLAPGTYVDTLTLGLAALSSPPLQYIDTLVVTGASGVIRPDLGANASFHGRRIFPENDPWNQRVDNAEVDPNSLAILTKVGLTKGLHPDFFANYNGGPYGIPYIVVPDDTPRYNFLFDYAGESDPGPYPVPPNPPIEGNGEGDAHLLVITRDEFKLYETFYTHFSGGQWTAGSGAIFNLTTNTQRPAGWTSADAAGLPIFPGLVRGDEVVEMGEITHALRMTIVNTRKAYIAPASHWASNKTDPLLPPMGMRVRLKASVNISGYPPQARVILTALKKYGMIVADNGGDFFLSGAPDTRWDDDGINLLKQIKVSDFEVIKMVGVVTP